MAAGENFMLRWQGWSGRFAALQRREKMLVIGAVAAAIVLGGYSLWIEPGMLEAGRLQKTLVQQQTEQEQLRTQLAVLAAQGDPDSGNRAALQRLREQLAAAERDLKGFDKTLVPPTQAPVLLQTLLARHRGLSLVSLTTLPPQPLVEVAPRENKGSAEEASKLPGGNIYKHGLEIKVAGSYHDLLAYVADLEAGPQKLLWGDMRLAVKEHPVSELTLTVFTLSLDATWLVV
jgi:MSHA biogenesis protein MshJ